MTRIGFKTVWQEATHGKSIGRILMNETLRQWQGEISGVVLDLACGRDPSYRRLLGLKENEEKLYLVGVDYNAAFRPTVVADLTRPLPFKDGVADGVIISSFLYIVSDPNALLGEVQRVLKSGGWLLLTAPLIYPHTPEPTDYWRFTEESLRLLLRRSGFVEAAIMPFGGRFSAAAYLLWPFLRPRWLVAPIVYWMCLSWMLGRNGFGCPLVPSDMS